MSGIEVLLAVAGPVVTVLVLAGMVLLVSRGVVEVHKEGEDPEGSNLSPLPNRRPARAPVSGRSRANVRDDVVEAPADSGQPCPM